MKKVLLTGATGLIGKEALQPLLDAGFEVFAISTKDQVSKENINWIKADIFDFEQIKKVFLEIKPEYLLHFAWVASGDYLSSETNYKLVDASMNMLKAFKENNGKRAVFAGTCFEYEFKNEPLKENDRLNPKTVYAQCKNELREKAEEYCQNNGISFGWGRIFYVYGHQENEKRLTPHLINSIKDKKSVVINCGTLVKDYMYTKDVASAFVKFLDSNVSGCVNICTSIGISLEDYSKTIAKKLNGENFLVIKNEATGQPPAIIGDNSRLVNEIKFSPKFNLDEALNEILKNQKQAK